MQPNIDGALDRRPCVLGFAGDVPTTTSILESTFTENSRWQTDNSRELTHRGQLDKSILLISKI